MLGREHGAGEGIWLSRCGIGFQVESQRLPSQRLMESRVTYSNEKTKWYFQGANG